MFEDFNRESRGVPLAAEGAHAVQETIAGSDGRRVSREEFAEVALACLQQLRRAACRLAGNVADADDLVQETYRLAFQHCRELRRVEHCGAWLRRILRRQAVTRLRRRLVAPRLLPLGEEQNRIPSASADEMTSHLALREVYAAIQALPPDLRLAVTLSEINGLPYAEIAAIAGCPIGTVRSRLARAKARLMAALRLQAEECGLGRARD